MLRDRPVRALTVGNLNIVCGIVTLRTGIRRLLLPLAGPVAERTVRWYVARLKAAAR